MDKPTCAHPAVIHWWEEMNAAGVPFCTDCLPEFQRESLRLGTCNHPEVAFRTRADGVVEGYFPSLESINTRDDGFWKDRT